MCLALGPFSSFEVSHFLPAQAPKFTAYPRHVVPQAGEFNGIYLDHIMVNLFTIRPQFFSRLQLVASFRKNELKALVSSLIESQLALDKMWTTSYLTAWGLMWISTKIIPAWSDIPGIVLMAFDERWVDDAEGIQNAISSGVSTLQLMELALSQYPYQFVTQTLIFIFTCG